MKERIFAICNQLVEQGIKPTLIKVRSELGGGSFSTINPLLKQWKEDRRMSDTHTIVDLHNEIATISQKATVLIWKAANDHYNKIKTDEQEELKSLRIKMAKAEVTISLLRIELEEVDKEKERLKRLVIFYESIDKQPKFKLTKVVGFNSA